MIDMANDIPIVILDIRLPVKRVAFAAKGSVGVLLSLRRKGLFNE